MNAAARLSTAGTICASVQSTPSAGLVRNREFCELPHFRRLPARLSARPPSPSLSALPGLAAIRALAPTSSRTTAPISSLPASLARPSPCEPSRAPKTITVSLPRRLPETTSPRENATPQRTPPTTLTPPQPDDAHPAMLHTAPQHRQPTLGVRPQAAQIGAPSMRSLAPASSTTAVEPKNPTPPACHHLAQDDPLGPRESRTPARHSRCAMRADVFRHGRNRPPSKCANHPWSS